MQLTCCYNHIEITHSNIVKYILSNICHSGCTHTKHIAWIVSPENNLGLRDIHGCWNLPECLYLVINGIDAKSNVSWTLDDWAIWIIYMDRRKRAKLQNIKQEKGKKMKKKTEIKKITHRKNKYISHPFYLPQIIHIT